MPDDKAVYLVSVDDGAENWQVIVFADDDADAMRVAKEAYEEEEGRPFEGDDIGVSRVKPLYFWLG